MRLHHLLAVVGVAAVVSGCSIEADHGNLDIRTFFGPTVRDDFRWSGKVAQGRTVEIKGVNGAIHAEATAGDRVELTATKTGRRHDPKDVKIEVVEHSDGVTICAVYPSADFGRPNECRPGKGGRMNVRNNDVNVEFTVKVPAGLGFVGRTVNGEIKAQSLDDTVRASTVNGSVRVSTSGYADATSVNGSITASLGRANWTEPLEFKTVNGSITLDLPGNVSAEIDAETLNGSVTSDFPITTTGRLSQRRVTGTIGEGGREIKLSSINGSIRLRRTQ